LLALELAMIALAAKQGWLRQKVRGWSWLIRNRERVMARRRLVQREKVVPDRIWMRCTHRQVGHSIGALAARREGPVNVLMRAYWWAASRMV
jgi:hypothetical protein